MNRESKTCMVDDRNLGRVKSTEYKTEKTKCQPRCIVSHRRLDFCFLCSQISRSFHQLSVSGKFRFLLSKFIHQSSNQNGNHVSKTKRCKCRCIPDLRVLSACLSPDLAHWDCASTISTSHNRKCVI